MYYNDRNWSQTLTDRFVLALPVLLSLVLWWAISEPALVGPSGGQLRFRQTPAVASELLSRRRDGRAERARHRRTIHNHRTSRRDMWLMRPKLPYGQRRVILVGTSPATTDTDDTPGRTTLVRLEHGEARRGTSPIYVLCMTILVELVHSVPYISTLLM